SDFCEQCLTPPKHAGEIKRIVDPLDVHALRPADRLSDVDGVFKLDPNVFVPLFQNARDRADRKATGVDRGGELILHISLRLGPVAAGTAEEQQLSRLEAA